MGKQPSKTSYAQNPNGNEEVLTINHPRFKHIRVVSPPSDDEEGIIEVTIPIAN